MFCENTYSVSLEMVYEGSGENKEHLRYIHDWEQIDVKQIYLFQGIWHSDKAGLVWDPEDNDPD